MNCPYCNKTLAYKKKCTRCGRDVSILFKAMKASNAFYNRGLSKARVHDLSGAEADLKKSLKLNKHNTQARNLLGLIYYECGEIVSALGEWVLSKHFQPEGNMAEGFLDEIQASQSLIDNYNLAIKKYNLALSAARQGNEDLALIQLKKVLSLSPNYLKAMHLMTLIFLKNRDYDKAKKILKRARRIDVSNNRTLTYIAEVRDYFGTDIKPEKIVIEPEITDRIHDAFRKSGMGTYDESEKSNKMLFVNLVIGIILGICVTAYLIVPTVKSDAAKEYNIESLKSNEGLTASAIEVKNLESAVAELEKKITAKDEEINAMNSQIQNLDSYNSLFAAFRLFQSGDKENAAAELSKVKVAELKIADANVLYDYIKQEVYADVVESLAQEGRQLCNAGKMEESLVPLHKAYNLTQDDETTLYFLGRAYQKLGNKEDATRYFIELVVKVPNGSRTSTAKKRLKELGYSQEEIDTFVKNYEETGSIAGSSDNNQETAENQENVENADNEQNAENVN